MDEKGVRLCLYKSPTMLAKKGARCVHSRGKEHGENVTVVGCGNGIGNCIPPMVIFKGVRKDDEWKDSMPLGSAVEMAPKGSMTSVLFCKWLQHLAAYKAHGQYLKYAFNLSKNNIESKLMNVFFQTLIITGPCLLILDEAKCHINFLSFKEAAKHGIHFFLLRSNTTHELQPFDKAVFHTFEIYWDEEVLNYWAKHPER